VGELDWAEALNEAVFAEVDAAGAKLAPAAPRRALPTRPAGRRPMKVAALAAALAVSFGALVVVGPVAYRTVAEALQVQTIDVVTGNGEIRRVDLADGSTITLGGRSSLHIRMSHDRREVRLLDGDAYFEVAPDADRPFTVSSGGPTATAVGTAFEVNHGRRVLQVAVTEGHVRAAGSGAPVMLAPGERASLKPGGALAVDTFDLRTVGRWRDHRAAFRDAPLGQVVETLDRYHPGGVVLADPSLADLQVSAAFRFEQMEVALQAMAAGHDLTVRRDADGGLVIDRAGGAER
jgi:transmembrane sensor